MGSHHVADSSFSGQGSEAALAARGLFGVTESPVVVSLAPLVLPQPPRVAEIFVVVAPVFLALPSQLHCSILAKLVTPSVVTEHLDAQASRKMMADLQDQYID